jgi:hypothetical protein
MYFGRQRAQLPSAGEISVSNLQVSIVLPLPKLVASRCDSCCEDNNQRDDMTLPSPVRQKAARGALENLFVFPAAVYAVHYACQSFYRGEQLASPRVTAIGLRQFDGGQITSFSILQEAEPFHISAEEVAQYLDFFERRLLESFFQFVKGSRHARFVHWNMRNAQYGFAALEHRLRVLGGQPDIIPESQRFDLASLMYDLYGSRYVDGTTKLENLARLNELSMGGFLRGADEAEAFEAGRYRDVLASTLCKVRIISEIAIKANDRTLNTKATWWCVNGGPYRLTIQKVRDNPLYSLLAGGAGAIAAALKFFEYFAR